MLLHNSPSIETFAGKWWVWKSTIAASTAIFYALSWKNTLAIDYDGWKAFARVIQFPFKTVNQIEKTHIDNLSFASIQESHTLKKRSEVDSFKEYFSQFPKDYWLVAFNEMLHEFFGASTDTDTLYKYISLVNIIQQAKELWFEKIVLDIEPTIWLQRLLNSTDTVSRSIENLSKKWWVTLTTIGAAWPDIKSFLQSPYIKNSNIYIERINSTKNIIQSANFSIVSIPEPEPLSQALWEVLSIIQATKGNVKSIILNNYWRLHQEVETKAHNIAADKCSAIGASLKIVPHNADMFNQKNRITVLKDIWESLYSDY